MICSHCSRPMDGSIQRCSNDGFCWPIEEHWVCENPECGADYAEYVNGCPMCYESGLHFSVRQRLVADKAVKNGSVGCILVLGKDWLQIRRLKMDPNFHRKRTCLICGYMETATIRGFSSSTMYCGKHLNDEIELHQSMSVKPSKDDKALARIYAKRWKSNG
jgi:hypothetical protein